MVSYKFLGPALLLISCAMSPARADAVDDYIERQMQRQHIPGLSLAVIKDGKPLKVKGYGTANLELNAPVKPETVFRIGSVSKQIIATAVLLLANDGKFSLDDKAVKYLSGAPDAWNGITLRHLLTHTSGLTREGPSYTPLRPQPDADLIKSAYALPLLFNPGEKWQYSNLGYFILAEVVAKVSGQPWTEFVTQRIFKPLGMDASRALEAAPVVANRAAGYVYANNQYQNSSTLLALRPSGAFMSSVNDLIKWDAALNRATLLPQTTLDTMWTSVKLNDGADAQYGFGFVLRKSGEHRHVAHGGSISGFRSYYLRLPDDKLSVILLANLENASSDTIATGVASQYVKELFPARHAITLNATELDAAVGTYQLRDLGRITFTRAGKGLRMQAPPGGIDQQLLPEAATAFYSEDDPWLTVIFGKDTGGRVDRAAIVSGGIEVSRGTKE